MGNPFVELRKMWQYSPKYANNKVSDMRSGDFGFVLPWNIHIIDGEYFIDGNAEYSGFMQGTRNAAVHRDKYGTFFVDLQSLDFSKVQNNRCENIILARAIK